MGEVEAKKDRVTSEKTICKTTKISGKWYAPLMEGVWSGDGTCESGKWTGGGEFTSGSGKNPPLLGRWKGESISEKNGKWNAKGVLKWTRGMPKVTTVIPIYMSIVGLIVGAAGLLTGVREWAVVLIIFMSAVLIVFAKLKGTWNAEGNWTDNQGDCIMNGVGEWSYGLVVLGKEIFSIKSGQIRMGMENGNEK